MNEIWIAGIAFLAGVITNWILGALRREKRTAQSEKPVERLSGQAVPGSEIAQGNGQAAKSAELSTSVSPHVLALLARAIREPLRQLRRTEGCPPRTLRQLERIAWQTRMMGASRRPMQTKLVSPISLLQEAAEEVPLLCHGTVGAAWSLLTRQPVRVDPERARLAFREIVEASAEICGEGGKLGIRIAPGGENGFPVQVEVEIGRPGSEADPLAFLVARHLLESQGSRVDVDGRITRVHLPGLVSELSAPAEAEA